MTPSEESMALNDILPLSSPQGTDLSHALRMTINVLYKDHGSRPSEGAAGARSAIEDTRLS